MSDVWQVFPVKTVMQGPGFVGPAFITESSGPSVVLDCLRQVGLQLSPQTFEVVLSSAVRQYLRELEHIASEKNCIWVEHIVSVTIALEVGK